MLKLAQQCSCPVCPNITIANFLHFRSCRKVRQRLNVVKSEVSFAQYRNINAAAPHATIMRPAAAVLRQLPPPSHASVSTLGGINLFERRRGRWGGRGTNGEGGRNAVWVSETRLFEQILTPVLVLHLVWVTVSAERISAGIIFFE